MLLYELLFTAKHIFSDILCSELITVMLLIPVKIVDFPLSLYVGDSLYQFNIKDVEIAGNTLSYEKYLCLILFVLCCVLLFYAIYFAVSIYHKSDNRLRGSYHKIKELNSVLSTIMRDSDIDVFHSDVKNKIFYRLVDGAFVTSPEIGDSYENMIHPDDNDLYAEFHRQVLNGCNLYKVNVRSKSLDSGYYRNYEHTVTVTERDKDGKALHYVFTRRDCTNEMKSIAQKAEMIKNINLTLKVAKIFRWSYEFRTGINRIYDSYGIEHVYSDNSENRIAPEDQARFEQFFKELTSCEKDENQIEVRIMNSSIVPSDYYQVTAAVEYIGGEPAFIHGIWKNITDEIKQRRDLINMQKKILLALSAGELTAWEYDCSTNILKVINGESITGHPGVYMDIDIINNHIHPDDINNIRTEFRKLKETGIGEATSRFRILSPNSWRWILVSYMPVVEDGVVTHITGVRRDITQEVELRNSMERKFSDVSARKNYLEMILDKLPLSIYIKDPRTQTFTFLNKMAKSTPEINSASLGFVSDQTDNISEQLIKESEILAKAETYTGNEKIYLTNGDVRDMLVTKIPVVYDNVKQLLVANVDITEKKKYDRDALILSSSLTYMNAFSWYLDTRDGFMKYNNELIFARNLNDFNTTDKFLEIIHEDDRELHRKTLSDFLVSDEIALTTQFRTDIRKIGVYEWWENYATARTLFDENNQPYKVYCGVIINIDERKKAELDVLGLKEKTELILENTTSGLVYIDNNYVVQWSNMHSVLGGIGRNCFNVGYKCYEGYGRTEPCCGCILQEVSGGGTSVQNSVKLGHRLFDIQYIPVVNSDVQSGTVLKFDDRTEHYNLIEVLNREKERAEESDSLKSAFLANMSHEIRTPLNAIVGFTDIAVSTEDISEREEYGRIIANNSTLLLKLIDDILDLSKIETGMFELKEDCFDFNMMIDEAYSTFCMNVDDDVWLSYHKPEENLFVYADQKRLLQILYNFLSNAVKYTSSGEIKFGYKIEGDNVKMYVRDTGIGISEENKKNVFQRFRKFDDFAQGTGLGLAISKALADSMPGAEIGFESEPDKGSEFWVLLPGIIRSCELPEIDQLASSCDKIMTPLRILVAEDIDSNYRLIQALLKDHEITRALNGFEAIELNREHDFDIILMDLKMPKMNGIEATREIVKENNCTPVIAISANAFDSDINIALKSGCADFISKPIDKMQLFDVLYRYAAGHNRN